ncbi:MAG: hypothetical protein IJM37_10645 [Lachnospiraceae bacterium]|nr:hypothetical protein [Lachnospiraceae bacterium]
MKYKKISDTAGLFANIDEYEYALIYLLSEIRLLKVCELTDINWDECYEARFFSQNKERHVFTIDGVLQAIDVEDDDIEENIVIKKYELNKGDKYLIVQEYLEYDEDGQVKVKLTRLRGVENRR